MSKTIVSKCGDIRQADGIASQSADFAVSNIRSCLPEVNGNQNKTPSHADIKSLQLEFYVAGKAGCAFAALAAKTPERFGWQQTVLPINANAVKSAAEFAISDPKVSMCSFIFPSVNDVRELEGLISTLQESGVFYLDPEKTYEGFRCIALRAQVGKLASWVSGFGPFDFFPATRQSPFVEIAFRVKSRPAYKQSMKEAPRGVIHLADLDFLGDLSWAAFQTVWKATLKKTAEILGHTPDLRSAAKTTFVIPI